MSDAGDDGALRAQGRLAALEWQVQLLAQAVIALGIDPDSLRRELDRLDAGPGTGSGPVVEAARLSMRNLGKTVEDAKIARRDA